MRIVVVDPTICVACRNCEYACAFRQSGDFDTRASNIRVNFYPEERVCIPWTCVHCGDGWCEEICPAGAISRDPETGAVKIDPELCAGCKMCLLACPSGSIHFDSEAAVSRKCDLCGGDPSCVKFCISGALQFLEAEEAHVGRREALDARLKRLLALDRRGSSGGPGGMRG
jgi:carbon-monoxide dehydrogenase iron sulfur subunit